MILFLNILIGFLLGYILGTNLFFKSKFQIIFFSIISPIITWIFVLFIWWIIDSKENIVIILGESLGIGIAGYITMGIVFSNRQFKQLRLHNKGFVKFQGEYKNDSKNGIWKYWNDDGILIKEESYKEGILLKTTIYENPNKIMQYVYENGLLAVEGMLINNKKVGKWKFLNEDSFLIKEEIYEDDKLMETIEYEYPNFS